MDTVFCPHGGWLVSTEPVPDDPADHWVSALRDVIGCNRIVCSACGAPVRSAPNLMPAKKLGKRLPELADTPDWSASPLLNRTQANRFYACLCRSVDETMTRDQLQDPDPNPMTDKGLPWSCAGHPSPGLPLVVDGLPVDGDTDLAAVVSRALRGEVPAGAGGYGKAVPAFWLSRLHYRLRGLPQAAEVSRAVATALGSSEPGEVGTALWFFRDWPHAAGSERIEALVERAGADAEFPVPFFDRPAVTAPALALAARALASETVDAEVLAMLRAAAVSAAPVLAAPARFDELLPSLVRHDAEWLARSAVAVVAPMPQRAGTLLRALREAGRDELVVVAGLALIENGQGDAVRGYLDNPYSQVEPSAVVLLNRLLR